MPNTTVIDRTQTPAQLSLPSAYNASVDFIDRHLEEGRSDKVAIRDDRGEHTYAEVAEQVNRASNALRTLGVAPGDRIVMIMADTAAFISVFFGAIRMGAVPVPLNTLLTTKDYDFMVRDSGAVAVVVSQVFWQTASPALRDQPALRTTVVDGECAGGIPALANLLSAAVNDPAPVLSDPNTPGFWLYTSGSTGQPKAAVHAQKDLIYTAELYGVGVLGIGEDDVVFSAAKLFFAYGLGNALSFPLHVGATAVLMAERPTPESVLKRIADHDPDIFYGVPTLYAGLLASGLLPKNGFGNMRRCTSAGEALPVSVAEHWQRDVGVPILDGIGSTEMLHIFLSNHPDDVKYGTTGKPVPGYELKLTDEKGGAAAVGEVGELWVKGPSCPIEYWNRPEKTLETFVDGWARTGDKYACDQEGYYVYQGRSDDMLKVGGIYVSPFEVEGALMSHPDVLEAAVVGHADENDLIKPKAFVIVNEGVERSAQLDTALKVFVKEKLAAYKYPRWIEFVEDFPRTATGKTQRFKLRAREDAPK
jgi:4-hydroxybenzoate-CoA ligase/benzoate-CoA ligase